MIISDRAVDLNIFIHTHTPISDTHRQRYRNTDTSMSLFYCIRSPPNCWTLQFSASHRPLASSYASMSHLSSPRPRAVSLFFRDLLKHLLPLVFPQKTDRPQPSETASGTLQRMHFPKMKPLLSEWTPCGRLRKAPASSKRRQATPGKTGGRGRRRLFLLSLQLTADPQTSQQLMGIEAGEPLVTPQPLIKPQHKGCHVQSSASQQSSTLDSPLKSS